MAEIIRMPKLGFDMAEGTLVRWVIGEGETVVKGAVLAEIETDKATVEVESQFDGKLIRHLVGQGEIVPVNTPIAVLGAADEVVDLPALLGETVPAAAALAGTQAAAVPVAATPTAEASSLSEGVRASPLARRLAQERGLDLRKVKGSGPQGRIVRKDVEAYQAPAAEPAEPAPVAHATLPLAASSAPAGLPAASEGEIPADQRIPLNRLRSAIGRRMSEAKQQIPHFYVTHEYRLDAVMTLRQQMNTLLPDDQKLSINDFVVRASALALRSFPNLNASLEGEVLVQHGQVNLGVAVAVEGGLLTVVCRDADRKTLRQISGEIRGMAARARAGRVRPEEIQGSTFSISNLGMFDVENFAAIINPPEAAILAVGSARQVAVVENGQLGSAWRLKATLSVDHRVSDGAEAARFLQALAQYLEEPLRLLV